MAAPLIAAGIALVRFGPAILRVAKKELANWVKKGGKEIKKPTISQKRESIVPSQLGKKVDKPSGYSDAAHKLPRKGMTKGSRSKEVPEPGSSPADVKATRKQRTIPQHRVEVNGGRPMDPSRDITFSDDIMGADDMMWGRDFRSGGSVKGRPAKRSAENS